MKLNEGSPKIRATWAARRPYFRYPFANCVTPKLISGLWVNLV
jgi:hypothetical protein